MTVLNDGSPEPVAQLHGDPFPDLLAVLAHRCFDGCRLEPREPRLTALATGLDVGHDLRALQPLQAASQQLVGAVAGRPAADAKEVMGGKGEGLCNPFAAIELLGD